MASMSVFLLVEQPSFNVILLILDVFGIYISLFN